MVGAVRDRVLILAWALLILTAADASARAELQVSPALRNVEASAGQVITEQIRVTASGDESIAVEFRHVDFGFDDASYQTRIIRDEEPTTTAFSTRGWFTVPKRRYAIPAGRTINIPLRIAVPRNTPGGTYLGGAFLRVVPAAASGGAQVQAVAETGTLLFIKVAGGAPPKARLDRFNVPGLISRLPITPRLSVRNDGDDFFTFSGTVTLSGPGRDDTVAVASQYVVPGRPRTLTTTPGARGDEAKPTLGSRRLGFGRYRVQARLRIEPTGTTLVATRNFWLVPTWLRIGGVALLVVLAAAIALLVRWIALRTRQPEVTPVDAVEPGDDEDADDSDSGSDEASDEPGPSFR